MRSALALAEVRWAAASLVAFAVAAVGDLLGAPWPFVAVAYLVCYVAGGWEPLLEGLRALRERTLDVDLLMVVAAVAAAAIGQWFDGGLLIVIFATSGALEAVMTARTRASIDALLDLSPETATRLGRDGEETVRAGDLVAGDTVLVRPGERIPGDGRVLDGVTEVDTATLTGEPVPQRRAAGDGVLAGTVNGTGTLRVRVERDAADSVVAGIAAQVARASETKSARQLWVERIEQRYSLAVVVATLALLAIPLSFGADFQSTLLRAMTFMIVASPCAVVLATMPPLLAAIAVAGRRGTLVKDATVLEALADVDAVALDKTGTVTAGRPRVVGVEAVGTQFDEDAAERSEGHPSAARAAIDTVLVLAAAAETGSEHVLGRAVVDHAARRGLTVPEAVDTTALPGTGVRARVDGHEITVGRPEGILPPAVRDRVDALERRGHTAVVVQRDGEPIGLIALADELRPGAAAALGRLTTELGREAEVLTGDAEAPARRVAGELGVARVHAGLLPADKVEHVRRWQDDGRRVLAVGDGINDAPLLASADVGLVVSTVGNGAGGLGVQAADGVLTRDPLDSLMPLVRLARRARRTARANLAFAAAVIVALVAWDLFGTLPLAVGVAGHELSTVLVCLNGLRLLLWPGWPATGVGTGSSDTERGERHAAQDLDAERAGVA